MAVERWLRLLVVRHSRQWEMGQQLAALSGSWIDLEQGKTAIVAYLRDFYAARLDALPKPELSPLPLDEERAGVTAWKRQARELERDK